MDRHRQPYPAKPWGYAGSPGHPYTEEWWAMVDQTPWKGWRTSKEYAEYCAKKQEDAIQAGVESFRRRVHTAKHPYGNGTSSIFKCRDICAEMAAKVLATDIHKDTR